MKCVIADTGPLVAMLDRDDQDHAWAVREGRLLPPKMLACEAVLSEVHVLTQTSPRPKPASKAGWPTDAWNCLSPSANITPWFMN